MTPDTAESEHRCLFRAASFAGAYAVALLFVGVLGNCFFGLDSSQLFSSVWLSYAFFFFPMSLGVKGIDLGPWGPLLYIVSALVGSCGRSIRLFRASFAVFVSLLILNIASCLSMGGCYRGD